MRTYTVTYKGSHLTINVMAMPSCCGSYLVYGLTYNIHIPTSARRMLYKRLLDKVFASTTNRTLYIMADAVGGENGIELPSIWDMCTNYRWPNISISRSKPVKNPNSLNWIQSFTLHYKEHQTAKAHPFPGYDKFKKENV